MSILGSLQIREIKYWDNISSFQLGQDPKEGNPTCKVVNKNIFKKEKHTDEGSSTKIWEWKKKG